ncbi:hypothetical protein VTJ83DRAFT_1857 [Remersonia thermophila]|uniref:Uncharacterized protein n=1 Tax=Remersonia thermophila TaxID=72144 RepID=A0ABR4DH43_9PEZI
MSHLPHDRRTQETIRRIQESGAKITPGETVRAWPVPRYGTSEYPPPPGGERPTEMWIEKGNSRAGLEHMMSESKQKEWEKKGIPRDQQAQRLPEMVEAWTTVGRHVSNQGQGTGRPIMSVAMREYNEIYKGAATMGGNGFGVGANSVSTSHINPAPATDKRAAIPGDVSDRTMWNLYVYPPNRADRSTSSPPDYQSGYGDSRGLAPPRADPHHRAGSMPPGYPPYGSSGSSNPHGSSGSSHGRYQN